MNTIYVHVFSCRSLDSIRNYLPKLSCNGTYMGDVVAVECEEWFRWLKAHQIPRPQPLPPMKLELDC